ncbi:MAG TPA: iron chelate uptake ABC transporter family permease subunit [Chitinophagaceae bacterium]|nr:iron chelate uptake ABC transporter family permease subunit [Chitinophagaceae bacterium]
MIKRKIGILVIALLICIALFMFYGLGSNLSYILPKRAIRVWTIIVVASSIGYSSIIFQTITQNKILTPSIMGYESVFILFQTILVFLYGDKTFQVLQHSGNFLLSTLAMLVFSLFIYLIIFKNHQQNIYQLLLIGLILGTLFQTLSSFLQIIIDPNEFSIIENHMFASFSNMNTGLLSLATGLLIISFAIGQYFIKYLDILALGREHAINLGVPYNKMVQVLLLIISIMVSVSTALVGPILFLGILVSNITYQYLPTHKHKYLLLACSLISCIVVFLGQFLIEHIFNFSTAVSIIINFIGGVYFIYLILKSRK